MRGIITSSWWLRTKKSVWDLDDDLQQLTRRTFCSGAAPNQTAARRRDEDLEDLDFVDDAPEHSPMARLDCELESIIAEENRDSVRSGEHEADEADEDAIVAAAEAEARRWMNAGRTFIDEAFLGDDIPELDLEKKNRKQKGFTAMFQGRLSSSPQKDRAYQLQKDDMDEGNDTRNKLRVIRRELVAAALAAIDNVASQRKTNAVLQNAIDSLRAALTVKAEIQDPKFHEVPDVSTKNKDVLKIDSSKAMAILARKLRQLENHQKYDADARAEVMSLLEAAMKSDTTDIEAAEIVADRVLSDLLEWITAYEMDYVAACGLVKDHKALTRPEAEATEATAVDDTTESRKRPRQTPTATKMTGSAAMKMWVRRLHEMLVVIIEDFLKQRVGDDVKQSTAWPMIRRRIDKIMVIKGYLAVLASAEPSSHATKLDILFSLPFFAPYKYEPLPPPLELHDPKAPWAAKQFWEMTLAAELRHDPIAANMDSFLKLQEDFADAVLESAGSGGLPTLVGGTDLDNTRDPIVIANIYNFVTSFFDTRPLTFGRFQQYDPVSHMRTFNQAKRNDGGNIWSVKEAGVGDERIFNVCLVPVPENAVAAHRDKVNFITTLVDPSFKSTPDPRIGGYCGIYDASKTTSSPNATDPVMIVLRIKPVSQRLITKFGGLDNLIKLANTMIKILSRPGLATAKLKERANQITTVDLDRDLISPFLEECCTEKEAKKWTKATGLSHGWVPALIRTASANFDLALECGLLNVKGLDDAAMKLKKKDERAEARRLMGLLTYFSSLGHGPSVEYIEDLSRLSNDAIRDMINGELRQRLIRNSHSVRLEDAVSKQNRLFMAYTTVRMI